MAETQLMVWIDQDLCTGDGICEEIAPDVFVGRDDGLWVVKEEASHFGATIVVTTRTAIDALELLSDVVTESLGPVDLRGVRSPIELLPVNRHAGEVATKPVS